MPGNRRRRRRWAPAVTFYASGFRGNKVLAERYHAVVNGSYWSISISQCITVEKILFLFLLLLLDLLVPIWTHCSLAQRSCIENANILATTRTNHVFVIETHRLAVLSEKAAAVTPRNSSCL